ALPAQRETVLPCERRAHEDKPIYARSSRAHPYGHRFRVCCAFGRYHDSESLARAKTLARTFSCHIGAGASVIMFVSRENSPRGFALTLQRSNGLTRR